MTLYDHFSERDRAVLIARAERLAKAIQEDDEKSAIAVLTVDVGEERYAMAMSEVVNVYEGISVTAVPCVPSFVAGIANIRGHIMPVLDLGGLLSVQTTVEATMPLVVVTAAEMTVGLRVTTISGTQLLRESDMMQVPDNLRQATRGAYLRGVLAGGTALLDLDALLSSTSTIAIVK